MIKRLWKKHKNKPLRCEKFNCYLQIFCNIQDGTYTITTPTKKMYVTQHESDKLIEMIDDYLNDLMRKQDGKTNSSSET